MTQLGRTWQCAAFALASAWAHTAGADGQVERAPDATSHIEGHPAVARARAFTYFMASRSNEVHRWFSQARTARRAAEARCLDRKLAELHAIERLARADERAVEAAVRAGGLTGGPMVRLVHRHDASRARLREAERCLRPRSARVPVRMSDPRAQRVGLRVRAHVPPLHDVEDP